MTGNEHKGVEPVLWGIFNPDTGRWRSGVFGVEASAKTYARRGTDNYTKLVAVPLFTAEALATKDAELSALRREVERLRGAISWVSPPFVDANTTVAELRKRVGFLLTDADRAALTHQEKDAQDV